MDKFVTKRPRLQLQPETHKSATNVATEVACSSTTDLKILPDNEHMKVGLYLLATVGLCPLNLKRYPILEKLYNLYGNIYYYYNLTFVTRQIIELVRLLFIGNVTRIMQNCSLTLLCTISALRVTVVRGKHIKTLMNHVIAKENKIKACEDDDMKAIYRYNIRLSQIAASFFVVVGWFAATPFYFGPQAEAKAYPELYPPDNVTGKIHLRLPLSAWVPFDYSNHYWITFVWQIADGWTAECYVVYIDSFLFGLMIFPVGQLQLLQHIMRNFRKFALRTQKDLGVSYEEASMITMRDCILFHKEIISTVQTLDFAMRWLMLLDFSSCSVQMSVLVFQVIMYPKNVVTMFALMFLISMVIQLFLFYWNANEITVESLNVPVAIWEGEWYDEPVEVQKCMQMFIMRAQKPLTLSIGPLYPMSTGTALSILKATYSYATLLRQSYQRRQ